ncbi:MAG TPA: transglycosylase domain-containing protein, partial [Tenuifilaceae bacterium]|nr:transglycosylase domain-containing protein [Tenuifilaceae bacterium]
MSFKEKSTKTKFLLWFWGIFIFGFLFAVTLFTLISVEFFGPMPTFEELENPRSNLASEIISEDHKLLGTYYIQNRTFVEFDELSPNLVNALLATEDIRFYKHSGIDARGLARVAVKTIAMGQSGSGGGSTITQQLAKNLFPRDTSIYSSSVARFSKLAIAKFKEWITAVKLER